MISGADRKAALSSSESVFKYFWIAFCNALSLTADTGGVGELFGGFELVDVDIPSKMLIARYHVLSI